ncbi:non-ribosomal peptide synthetase [Polyangium jinanense]|uniref:Amino acid adenylation domain-containing protein n=1 Tax=Polyangium jinanense TaxID=2829994 RepID=A0A9X3XCD2_9BACT|nr:amino acid adenylation domain-containing protein [Polyangium jinanense]MDC3957723.1 amino acid adenylation domain-containing protein [Polyangium jinanense]MDC3987764.1 amino acid adenylation domain-containing protein [Polyangium jinanense]
MSVIEMLRERVLEGFRFWIEGERLRYRAPREAATEARLAELRQHKDEILDVLRRCPEKLEVCPLSHGQRALWFLWRLSPESSTYNQSEPLRIRRSVDLAVLRKACRALVARHPMLRTTFRTHRGEPMQEVGPAGDIDWAEIDASSFDEARLGEVMRDAHRAPFDLERGPVVRFRCYTRAPDEHLLFVTMHHIVCDGWSFAILAHDLPVLLDEIEGRGAPLPQLVSSYHDYVRWQREMLAGPEGERLWQAWKQDLAGPLPPLSLPTDFPRPAMQTYRGDSCPFTVPDELAARLRALAGEEGATLHATLLTAFLALLYRYSGQKDLVIGTHTSGRGRNELLPIVGYFVDPVVIRVGVSEGRTFRAFLQDVKRTTQRALENRDFPFPLLVERLRPERDPSRSPLFDVAFNHLSTKGAGRDGALEILQGPHEGSKFDLTLTVMDGEATIAGSLDYNSDLFRRETAARFTEHLVRLLASAVEDPERALDDIDLLGEGTGGLPAVLRGRPQRDPRARLPLHALIEEQVARSPSAPALSAGGVTLTYAELNARANVVAHHLRALGVGRDARVAVCTGRSAEVMIAILAILKAGGAYVPLDPGYPGDLLAYMLKQAGVTVVLTQRAFVGALPASEARVVCVEEVSGYPETNPEPLSGPEDLVYVMFTSGSTGRPKGVAIEHRSLTNYVLSMIEDLAMEPGSRFALVSTISADLGNTVVFPSLCTGGCLHVVPEEALVDSAGFGRYVTENQIDYLKIVPSHLAALTEASLAGLPRKAVFLGGEPSPLRWVERLASLSECRFFNHYGPTETTVGVLTYRFEPAEMPLPAAILPLRTPVADATIHLLDARMRAVPPGVAGELYVGGTCVARGYINDPERTRERFVRDPMGSGALLYRTGDLARQLPTGDIEILGRQDRQIKLRGYRIELGQIESILRKDPRVQQCAVLPDVDGPRASRLIAYVVPAGEARGEGAPSGEELWAELRALVEQQVPRYMVPSRCVLVPDMPLTPNGKVDHRALRALDTGPAEEAQRALPRDALELELCTIFGDVLGAPSVGPRDDFFQLGGHSLLAVRLVDRIHERLGERVALGTLLANPTVEGVAGALRAGGTSLGRATLLPIRARGRLQPLVCLPGAGGNVMYFHDLTRPLGAERPVWGLQAIGLDDGGPIPTRIEDIAARYVEELGRTLPSAEPYLLVGHSFGGLVAFEMARLLREAGRGVGFLGVIDNPAPSAVDDGAARRDDTQWLLHIATRIGKLYGVDLALRSEAFSALSYGEQVASLVEKMLVVGLLPSGTNRAHFARFIEVYKANAIAAATYRSAGGPIDVPIRLFRAREEDPELEREAVAGDATLGWQRFTRHSVEVFEMPGTHITMMTEPHVRALGSRMAEIIGRD